MNILDGLNDTQKEAVLASDEPVLVLAGAGSGKTKTLTHRIAHLIADEGVYPSNILAVTFTNKAAREMRQRLADLLNRENNRGFMPWMGTFHSICVRMLRVDGQAVGIPANFVIYDEDDRKGLVKQALKNFNINDKGSKASAMSAAISSAKNALQTPDTYRSVAVLPFQKDVANVYEWYEARRREANALDFDDLLLEVVNILETNREIREKWNQKFKHILIDEYQDTNQVQYRLIKLLTGDNRDICVVGDDWQSIYSWRGADFKNILNFERDFPGARVIKLEQNYRSTTSILDAAHAVITKNSNRSDKKLWTNSGTGTPVKVVGTFDEAEEARMVAENIFSQVAIGARHYRDYAVLYRLNSLSLSLERALMQYGVPYQIVGGLRFYDRREIKDIMAYLKLIYQPNDRMSFARIANVPARGVGEVSLAKFLDWQSSQDMDIIEALVKLEDNPVVGGRAQKTLLLLGKILRNVRQMIDTTAPSEIIEEIVRRTGYRDYLYDGLPQAEVREENLGVFIADSQQFTSLEELLEEVSLMSSSDTDVGDDSVTLMTLHAAKGLEFPSVFMVGLEEGILPHARTFDGTVEDLEEERRLCYVGMTRAMEELTLSYAYSRLQYGNRMYNQASRFISDMGDEVEVSEGSGFGNTQDIYYDDVPGYDVGDDVMSDAFGKGKIVDVDGLAVTVAFSSGKTKKLNVEFARLKKL